VGLRKSLPTLLSALEKLDPASFEFHIYGSIAPESHHELAAAKIPITHHGPVGQSALAEAFRNASVLVLPSLEEGFGLVIPQALNCGLPCIVSDRVGAQDLIMNHENGSIFPALNTEALATELQWWQENWHPVTDLRDWSHPASKLIKLSTAAAGA
jgi:glycosyltransferase involved in cell wall biosynthesis